jgi:hypothetical protein
MERRAFRPDGVAGWHRGEEVALVLDLVVPAPGGMFTKVAVPPILSAMPITAPPCRPPLRLVSSSRTTISATTLSRETSMRLSPISLANGG